MKGCLRLHRNLTTTWPGNVVLLNKLPLPSWKHTSKVFTTVTSKADDNLDINMAVFITVDDVTQDGLDDLDAFLKVTEDANNDEFTKETQGHSKPGDIGCTFFILACIFVKHFDKFFTQEI